MKQRVFKYDYLVRITLFGIILFAALNDVKGEEVGPADNNDGLLNVIQTEAKQMEVFPLDYVINGKSDWGLRYELTFERFKPIYRFKERACVATLAEVNECVARMDELNSKEKALVLTAICLFERTRRPCPDERVAKYGNADDKRLTPYPNESENEKNMRNWTSCFPAYRPDQSISNETWRQLKKFVEKYRDSKEIAFSAFEPSESELKDQWIANIQSCVELMKSKLDPNVPWEDSFGFHFIEPSEGMTSGGMTDEPIQLEKLKYSDDSLTLAFLEKVASLEKNSALSAEETNELIMLREYWFMNRSCILPLNTSIGPRMGNSSTDPKTLGFVARQLSQCRIRYK